MHRKEPVRRAGRKLASVVAIAPIFVFAAGAACGQSLNDTTYAVKSVRHAHSHGGAANVYGAGSVSGSHSGAASTGLGRTGVGAVPSSGWHQGGFGGTLNPGWGNSFGPQLGGIGR